MGLLPKSDVPDSDYLFQRAQTEAAWAGSAQAGAARAHQRLASEYLDRLFGEKMGPARAMESRRQETQEALTSIFRTLKPPEDLTGGAFHDLLVSLDR